MKTSISKTMITKSTLAKDISNKLRHDIIIGQFQSGMRLREAELADQYEVSRGTIRSTLQELSTEGLVEFLDSGGCVVVGLDEKMVRDTYLFRQILEVQSAQIILQKNDISYASMADILSEYSRKEDNEEYKNNPTEYCINMDMEFHMAFVEAADNRPILRAWCSLAPVIKALLSINLTEEYRNRFAERFYEHHKAILDYAILRNRNLIDEVKSQMSTGVEMCIENLRNLKLVIKE